MEVRPRGSQEKGDLDSTVPGPSGEGAGPSVVTRILFDDSQSIVEHYPPLSKDSNNVFSHDQ